MKEKMIGILAGMGPYSTAPFIDLVLSQCQIQYNAVETNEFPHILVYSLPAPLYLDRPIDHIALTDSIRGGLLKLESAGADFIAIPCNTAHRYYDELAKSISVPLMNIVEESVHYLRPTTAKATVLATRMTIGSGIYQSRFEDKGIEFILREEWQQRIDVMIEAIQRKPYGPSLEYEWQNLVSEISGHDIDQIILGCTDLNVVSEKITPGSPVLDATSCLAEAVVRKYLTLRNDLPRYAETAP
jgi:aspartate racemase